MPPSTRLTSFLSLDGALAAALLGACASGSGGGVPPDSQGGGRALLDARSPPAGEPPIACNQSRQLEAGASIGAALPSLTPGTCLIVPDGDYAAFDVTQKGTAEAPIVIRAKTRLGARITSGDLKMTGAAHAVIEGFTITSGGGVRIDKGCQHCRLTRNRFVIESNTEAWVFVELRETTHTRIDHNDFGPKADLGNFVKLGWASMPQQTRIDHNHFHDNGPRATNGKEALRIGWSKISMEPGHTVIEQNLFSNCDGDPEIVSVKSGHAFVRNNTVRTSAGVLALRHGNNSEVSGTFIFGDKQKARQGGIRVYGQNHRIYNNYIEGTTGSGHSAPIALDGGDVQAGGQLNKHHQSVDVEVVNNTLVDNASGIEIGKNYKEHPPQGCLVANNVIAHSQGAAIEQAAAASITYDRNIVSGGTVPAGLTEAQVRLVDPKLTRGAGRLHPSAGSPTVDAGRSVSYVTTDIDGQFREAIDVGADELSSVPASHRPLTAADVGPDAP